MNNNIAIILARGGSKGVPGKNWIDFGGVPLIKWSIFAALEDDICNKVIISSDSKQIKAICEDMKDKRVSFLPRPSCYCTDNSPSEMSISHAISTLNIEEGAKICFLQPTSPFRHGNLIEKSINSISEGQSSFTAFKHTPLFWKETDNSFFSPQYSQRKMRQDFSKKDFMWHDCGNVYSFYAGDFKKCFDRHAGKVKVVECDIVQSMQIDNYSDLELCRKSIDIEAVKKWFKKIAH